MVTVTELFIYWLVGCVSVGTVLSVIALFFGPVNKIKGTLFNLLMTVILVVLLMAIGYWVVQLFGLVV